MNASPNPIYHPLIALKIYLQTVKVTLWLRTAAPLKFVQYHRSEQ